MNGIDEEVRNIITKEVFICFAKGKFEKAKKILDKLLLQYYNQLEELEIKRLLLHNLAWVEHHISDTEGAKRHITQIREEIEQNVEYIYNNKLKYSKLLNLYVEIYEEEIDQDQYIEIQIFNQSTYSEIGAIGEYVIAKVNVNFKLEEYDEIVESIKYLNDRKSKDNNYEYCIKEIMRELEKHSKVHYKEALNIIKIIHIERR